MTNLKIAIFSRLTIALDRLGGWIGGPLSEWVWSFAAADTEKQYRDRKGA